MGGRILWDVVRKKEKKRRKKLGEKYPDSEYPQRPAKPPQGWGAKRTA